MDINPIAISKGKAYALDAPAIRCAVEQRMRTFYQGELELRRSYGYPPCGGLVRFLWRSEDPVRVQRTAEEHGRRIEAAAAGLGLLGPTPAGIPFLQGSHRWHLLAKGVSRGAIQGFLDRLGDLQTPAQVHLAVDVDPYVIN